MILVEISSLKVDQGSDELPVRAASVEDLRGPLSREDVAFLQAWVDFAPPDAGQQFCDTAVAEDLGDIEVGPETLVLATRKFALTQRIAMLRDDDLLPRGSGYRTYGNAVYSPRASRRTLLGSCQLCFNPLFGASFHDDPRNGAYPEGSDDDDDDGDLDDVLTQRLVRNHLPYEYEALMRADMRDLEAYDLIHWSPDDLVDAALERDFGSAQLHREEADGEREEEECWGVEAGEGLGKEAPLLLLRGPPSSAGGDGGGGTSCGGCGGNDGGSAICAGGSSGCGGSSGDSNGRSQAVCSYRDSEAWLTAAAPCTPSARTTTPSCFRSPASVAAPSPRPPPPSACPAAAIDAAGAASTPGGAGSSSSSSCSSSNGATNYISKAEEADWQHFLDGLGELSYEYEALMQADMQDLEAYGMVNWSPDDLVGAALGLDIPTLPVPPAATDPRVSPPSAPASPDPGELAPATPTTPQLKEAPWGRGLGLEDSLPFDGGNSRGDGAAALPAAERGDVRERGAGSLPFGSTLPSLALPSAPCLSAPTDLCASPPGPTTPAASCEPPSCFQGPAARALARMIVDTVAAEAAAAEATCATTHAAVSAGLYCEWPIVGCGGCAYDGVTAAGGGGGGGNGGGKGGGQETTDALGLAADDDGDADWRRFLGELGHLPYEFEALMLADMRDLEAYDLVHWSVDELVEATLARGLGPCGPAAAAVH